MAGDAPAGVDADDERVLAAIRDILARGKPATLRAVRAAAGIGKDKVDNALARLDLAGRIVETRGPNRARLFGVAECGQVTDAIDQHVESLGAACIIRSEHGCLAHRGARKPGAVMVTASYTGRFLEDDTARAELHRLMIA